MATNVFGTGPDVPYAESTAEFVEWFQQQPGTTFAADLIELQDLRHRDAGRGMVAIKDIPEGTCIFTVPRTIILTAQSSPLYTALPELFQGDNAVDSWTALILVMMSDSMWQSDQLKPYRTVLPLTFDTPMFWTNEELDNLQASTMRSKIGKSEAEDMFRTKILPVVRAHPELFSSSQLTDEQLLELGHRFGSIIMAYAFDLEEEEEGDGSEEWIEDKGTTLGLVPMADILNSDAEFNVHVNHEEDYLTVVTLRDIRAGEEILNYYGPLPNSELLRRYGYVSDKHTRYDVCEIPRPAMEAVISLQLGISFDILQAYRSTLDEDEVDDAVVLERTAPEPSSEGILTGPAVLDELDHLHSMIRACLKALKEHGPDLAHPAFDQEKRPRIDAIKELMVAVLQTQMRTYQTRIEEDESLLRTSRSRRSKRFDMAVRVRLGEKKLLQEALALLENDGAQSRKKRRTEG